MKGIKKSFGIGISALLLLCFSVTVLPLDFFHNHAAEQTVCKDPQTNKPCNHSVHVTSNKGFCWVCAIHVDNAFVTTDIYEKILSLPAIRVFAESEITGYFVKQLFAALRGPPQAD